MKQQLKKIGTDILGVILIIIAILFGWLPGIAGIPLFLAGLSLLAINHVWARRALEHAKRHGLKFLKHIFNEHRVVVIIYDIVTVILAVGAFILLATYTTNVMRLTAITLIVMGVGLFFGNRKRLERFVRHIRRTPPEHKH